MKLIKMGFFSGLSDAQNTALVSALGGGLLGAGAGFVFSPEKNLYKNMVLGGLGGTGIGAAIGAGFGLASDLQKKEINILKGTNAYLEDELNQLKEYRNKIMHGQRFADDHNFFIIYNKLMGATRDMIDEEVGRALQQS